MRKSALGLAFLFLFGTTAAFSQSAVISFSPPSFGFSAEQGGQLPVSQTLQISNSGGGTLGWQISSNVNWLSATPASGSAPGNITVSIIRTNLPPNTYTGKLTITGNATNSPQEVPVTYTVTAPITATISFSPPSFSFNALQDGSLPVSETLQVSNSGTGTLNWSISSSVNWLSAGPASGTAPHSVTVSITRTNLPPNTYTGKLTILGNATNSPQEVPVTYTVSPAQMALLSLSPDTFNFSAMQGGSPPAPETLQIQNNGTGSMTWSFSEDIPPWLSVSPPGPAAPTDVQLTALPGNLTPGTRTYYLKVFSNQATNSPDSVRISFTVTSAQTAVISFSPPSFSFSAVQNGPLPSSQTLQISNSGNGTLNWTISSNLGEPFIDMDGDDKFDPSVDRFITCNCPENQDLNFNSQYDGDGVIYTPDLLAPTPASGTAPSSVTVAITRTNLPPGTYPGKLTIAGNATNSPQEVPVHLHLDGPVLSPASLQISQTSLDFYAQRNQVIPSQSIDITNGGQLPLNWTATILHGAAWLSINPGSGTDDGTITVSATTDLDPLTYVDTIKIEAPGALNAPRFIPVRLNIPTAVGDKPGNRPRSFALFQNYPNPFNPTTKIDFALPHSGYTMLEVFNVVGQRIRVLVEGELSAGRHSVVWDGRETSGRTVGSGIYFYRLKSQNFSDIKRMVLLK